MKKKINLKSIGLTEEEFKSISSINTRLRGSFGLNKNETKVGISFKIVDENIGDPKDAVDYRVVELISGIYISRLIIEEVARTYGPDDEACNKAEIIQNPNILFSCQEIINQTAVDTVNLIEELQREKNAKIGSLLLMKKELKAKLVQDQYARAAILTHAIFTSVLNAIVQVVKEQGIEVRDIFIQEGYLSHGKSLRKFVDQIKELHPDKVRLN